MNNIINKRIENVRNYMKDNDLSYYIAFTADPHLSEYINETDKLREYLTGFTGSAGTFLIGAEASYLWVDGRYYIQADNETADTEIKVLHLGEKNVPDLTDFLKKNVSKGSCIGFDGNYISEKYLQKMEKSLGDNVILDINHSINDSVWPDRNPREFSEIRYIENSVIGTSPSEKISTIRDNINQFYRIEENYNYVISDLTSVMWIANLRGNDIKHVPVAYSYMIITKAEIYLFINKASLTDECINHIKQNNIIIKDYSQFIHEVSQLKSSVALFDSEKTNSYISRILCSANEYKYVKDSLLIRKDIKNSNEIENIRKYHIVDAVSMVRFIMWLKKIIVEDRCEISEYDAAVKMDELRLSCDECYSLSFDTISAYDKNAALPHYSAESIDSSIIKPRGFYLVDCGGQYPLCTTDVTRTISLGELTQYEKDCYTYVLKGNLRLMNAVFIEGTRGENLDILARETLWSHLIDFRHGTGHGIGCELSVHEGPLSIRYRIPDGDQQPQLCPGMIVSDEPGVYFEGIFGIRLENELLVNKKITNEFGMFMDFESMTLVPFDLDAINVDLLNEEEKIQLNNYHEKVFYMLRPYLDTYEVEWLKNNTKPI